MLESYLEAVRLDGWMNEVYVSFFSFLVATGCGFHPVLGILSSIDR